MTLLLFIVAPQSLEFINKVISNLCEKLHIDQRISSAYHPQTNGLDERFNQTLIRSLQKVVGICIKPVLFALPSSFCMVATSTTAQSESEEEGFSSNEAFDDTVAKHRTL